MKLRCPRGFWWAALGWVGVALWPGSVNAEWREVGVLTASNASRYDGFGTSLSLSGDGALFGAPAVYAEHAAYVFTHGPAGWAETAKLTPPGQPRQDYFGTAVSLSGDHAIVTEPGYAHWSGVAHIFEKVDSTWTYAAELVPAGRGYADYFGRSAAMNGKHAIVGSIWHSHNGMHESGAAYVFERGEAGWDESAKLVPSDLAAEQYLGYSVAVNGDVAVVGSTAEAAYVFERGEAGWFESQKLVPSDGTGRDGFGQRVAVDGDTILVSAKRHDVSGISDSGCVYVYERAGGTWAETGALVPSDPAAEVEFGEAVALGGNTAVVGCYFDDGGAHPGAAYIFERQADAWSETARLTASDAEPYDAFGCSATVEGGNVMVGTGTGPDNCGQVYVFTPEPATLALLAAGAAGVMLKRRRR